ncbi:TIGR02269 family lipoprotein [Pyxidicoccus trucidator]|uniref:SitA6 family polymorphic toxin lipoprotein n=1 Tax=Pyxidicoccus trucidator TaxID=2709662 RepID=UPI0013DA9261|nr:TIGR02269 family lipoprotein [Pyxidicoccus trucidator]
MPSLLLALATVLLAACGSSSPSLRAWDEADGPASCEQEDSDQCVAIACEDETCGIFDCEDVASEAVASAPLSPRVELAQAYRTPWRPPAFRNWRSTGIRPGAQPRMTFHFRYRQGFLPALRQEPGKRVKHHLFPQEPQLADWFRQLGVDIHKFTMLIPEHIHREIHSGTGRGGNWNQAWREYHAANQRRRVPPDELHRKAVELIFRFELTGPVIPYSFPAASFGPQIHAP